MKVAHIENVQHFYRVYFFFTHGLQGILELLYAGKIREAVETTNKIFPTVLPNSLDVQFQLECQMFIELVRSRQLKEALKFAQDELGKFGIQNNKKYIEPLQVLL